MRENIFSGKFIVFEGLDGSGQSTQAELLRDFLLEKDFEVVLTKEPTLDSDAGKRIKRVLGKEIVITPKNLQELFVEDRKEHLEKTIIPALKEGKMVISDRYFFSTFAYGSADGLDLEWLIKINDQFLLPDLTFLLKVSAQICIERIVKRSLEKTLFEKKEKLEKVWQTYEILPGRFNNIYLIDGTKSVEEVFLSIKNRIKEKLKL